MKKVPMSDYSTMADSLLAASQRSALECAVAALGAARSHRLGLPAAMEPEEAAALWRESAGVLRQIGLWPFPANQNQHRRHALQRIETDHADG